MDVPDELMPEGKKKWLKLLQSYLVLIDATILLLRLLLAPVGIGRSRSNSNSRASTCIPNPELVLVYF